MHWEAFGSGDANIIIIVSVVVIVIVVIVVLGIVPLLFIVQDSFPCLERTLHSLDIEPVLLDILLPLLLLPFITLGCYLFHLCHGPFLLLTPASFCHVGLTLAYQSTLYFGDCACAQFIGSAEDVRMGWLCTHCTTQLTLGDQKLEMDIGTG